AVRGLEDEGAFGVVGCGVERTGPGGVNRKRADVGDVRQARARGGPRAAAVCALEEALAAVAAELVAAILCRGVERGRGCGSDDEELDCAARRQARAGGAAGGAAVRAFYDAVECVALELDAVTPPRPGVQCGRRYGIDGEREDRGLGVQARVDRGPSATAVRALEETVLVGRGVERRRISGIDGERVDVEL